MLLWSLLFQVILFHFFKTDANYVPIGANARINKNLDGDTYIIGGENTTIEDVSYQILLYRNEKFYGGGSIIKPNVILTAAHLVYKWDPTSVTIRAGSSYKDKKGGQLATVARICIHPKYGNFSIRKNYDYDVAVLLLEKNLPLGPTIKPIELRPVNEVVPDGTTGVISGWGKTRSTTSQLQKTEVVKVNFNLCKAAYQTINERVTARMTCYGRKEGGKDSCQGDSGGPLVVNGKQVGIVSWGKGCALAEFPGIYTDITNEEIQEHIFNFCIA